MRKPPAATVLVAATLSLTLGLSLSACSEDEPSPTAADVEETPSSPTSSTASSSPTASTPTESAASSASTPTLSVSEQPTATITRPAPVQVAAMLLPADGMGKLNAEWTWAAGNDFDSEPDRLASCHRAALQDIGARKVAVREYTSELDAGVRAHHLVAGMPDELTARRAYAVLESWRDGCQARLEARAKGKDGVRVTDPESVRTSADAASSYVVFQPTATGSTRVENVALARDARVVHLVVVELEGDDFSYPRGRTPAAVGVRNATQSG